MRGFGVHTSMWAMGWTHEAAERAVAAAKKYDVDFIEIALLQPAAADAAHTRKLLRAERSPRGVLAWPAGAGVGFRPARRGNRVSRRRHQQDGRHGLRSAIRRDLRRDRQRTGKPPTQEEIDNITRVLVASAKTAKSRGIELGIEAVNRYENHIVNTAQQAVDLVERVGADNIFVHLDTYHMNIEEKGAALGILVARDHLKYIHLSESDRGTPGEGNCPWDAIFTALAAIDFKGGLAMESFINLPPEIGAGLSVWRPVAKSEADVMGKGLPFLRNKALQYKLIQ